MKKLGLVFLFCSLNLFAQGPGEPFNPMTAPGARGVSGLNHTLCWKNPFRTTYNKIFLSQDQNLVATLDLSALIFDGYPDSSVDSLNLSSLGFLGFNNKYYWRVVEYDSSGFTNGQIWYFFTRIDFSEYVIFEDDFSQPSDEWRITNDGGTCLWEVHDAFEYTLPPLATGNVLAADADYCGSGSSTLTSAILKLPMFQGVLFLNFEWDNDWQALNNSDSGLVQISKDDGNSWETLRTFDVVDVRNTHEILSYSDWSSPNDSFIVRFKSIQPGWDWWWAIDNLKLTYYSALSAPQPPSHLYAFAQDTILFAKLYWDAGHSYTGDPIIGYRIYRKTGLPINHGQYSVISQTDQNTFEFIDQNINLDSIYTYKVCTVLQSGRISSTGNEATVYVPSIIPVEIITFTASVYENKVTLNWQTATETNNQGFQIERRKTKDERSDEWNVVSFVNGYGTTTEPQAYSFVDENLSAGKYNYRLKQIDFDGTFEYSNVIEVEIAEPLKFSLEQNYPNPFNPVTSIQYSINSMQFVILKVYDVLGKEFATLVNEEKPAGSYEVKFDASKLASGIYYYQLRAGEYVKTKKMILLK